MEMLQQIMLENELAQIKESILRLHKMYNSKKKEFQGLNEGVLDFESDDLGFMFDEAKKRFQAAQRGIKLANKLGDPEQKSRVFANFNRLRALVKRLEQTIEKDLDAMEQQLRAMMQNRSASMQSARPQAQLPPRRHSGFMPQQGQQQQQATP